MGALRSVVFPDPVPPEFNTFSRPHTISCALACDEQRVGWVPCIAASTVHVDEKLARRSLNGSGAIIAQQASVTSCQRRHARVGSRRWWTTRRRWRPTRSRCSTSPGTVRKRGACATDGQPAHRSLAVSRRLVRHRGSGVVVLPRAMRHRGHDRHTPARRGRSVSVMPRGASSSSVC